MCHDITVLVYVHTAQLGHQHTVHLSMTDAYNMQCCLLVVCTALLSSWLTCPLVSLYMHVCSVSNTAGRCLERSMKCLQKWCYGGTKRGMSSVTARTAWWVDPHRLCKYLTKMLHCEAVVHHITYPLLWSRAWLHERCLLSKRTQIFFASELVLSSSHILLSTLAHDEALPSSPPSLPAAWGQPCRVEGVDLASGRWHHWHENLGGSPPPRWVAHC